VRRFPILLAGASVVAALVPAAFAAPHPMHEMPLAIAMKVKGLGTIVETPKHFALYAWTKEKPGAIACTGECEMTWPPLVVPAHTMVAKHVKGIMGTFGTIKRPDGRTQLTLDRRALYTYHGDKATRILGNGVNGWSVVKA
jgi:predicted lipoprotein with Yx(FWY)xxD motif